MVLGIRRRNKILKVGNVHISLIYHTRLKFLIPTIEDVIKKVVANNNKFYHFSLITFILEDDVYHFTKKKKEIIHEMLSFPTNYKKLGFVRPKEIIISDNEFHHAYASIHIIVDSIMLNILIETAPFLIKMLNVYGFPMIKAKEKDIIKFVKASLYLKLISLLNHEITHANHNLKESIRNKYDILEAKIEATKIRMIKNSIKFEQGSSDYHNCIAAIREIVEILMIKINSEGIAEYFGKILYDIRFIIRSREDQFADFYLDALNNSYKFFTKLKKFISSLNREGYKRLTPEHNFYGVISKLKSEAETIYYKLGFHMAFTIVYSNFPEDKLDTLSIAQFFRLYEKACEKRKVPPLVTLSSNKGKLFDYKEALRMLHRAEKA